MKKKILGVLLTLVLAVTGFGLVGCGGGSNPAPGPGPGPAVSYDDDTTPVDIDETGLLFGLYTTEMMEADGWEDHPDYNQAFVCAMTEDVEDLVIPAYVTDGEHTYRVVGIENLIMTIDNVEDQNYIGINEQALGVKTITIPSTVEYFAGVASWWIEEFVCMENLESIILNNRTTAINIRDTLWELEDMFEYLEFPEGVNNDEEWNALCVEVFNQFGTYDEENDLFYMGNPSNPYMVLVTAGNSYWGEPPEGEFEIVANVNENCKVIGDCAISGSHVTGVVLPEGLKTIGDGAFYECRHLAEIELPNGLKYIGRQAFFYCNGIEYIEIPTSVEYMGRDVVSNFSTILYVDHDLVEYLPYCGASVIYVLKTLVDAAEEGVYPFDYYYLDTTCEEVVEDVAIIEIHNDKEYYGFRIIVE